MKLRNCAVFLFTLCCCQAAAQNSDLKSWGIFVGPHVTNYRYKSGVGVSYPFNTTYSEQGSTNIFVQLVRQTTLRKNIQLGTNFTFSNFEGQTNYHYADSYPLFYKTIYERKRASFIGLGPAFSYRLSFKRISVNPFAGLAANVAVESLVKTQQEVNGDVYTLTFDVRDREKQILVNYDLGVKIAWQLQENFVLQAMPFYRHFLTPGYVFTTSGKIFYSSGIALGVAYLPGAKRGDQANDKKQANRKN